MFTGSGAVSTFLADGTITTTWRESFPTGGSSQLARLR
jgi:hypothetical protein